MLGFQFFSGPVSTVIQSTWAWKPVDSQLCVDLLVKYLFVRSICFLFFFSYLVSYYFLVTREANACESPQIIFLAVHE